MTPTCPHPCPPTMMSTSGCRVHLKRNPPQRAGKARGKLEIALPLIWTTQVVPPPPFCIRRWLSPDPWAKQQPSPHTSHKHGMRTARCLLDDPKFIKLWEQASLTPIVQCTTSSSKYGVNNTCGTPSPMHSSWQPPCPLNWPIGSATGHATPQVSPSPSERMSSVALT